MTTTTKHKQLVTNTKELIVVILEASNKIALVQKLLRDYYKNQNKDKQLQIVALSTGGHLIAINKKLTKVPIENPVHIEWQLQKNGLEFIKKLQSTLSAHKNSQVQFILALDSDREGESIAKETLDILQEKCGGKINYLRVYFKSITPEALAEGMKNAKPYLDQNLLKAYQARVTLDIKIGFGLSPICWRMLSKCPCMGRVQTSALSLINEREIPILKFQPTTHYKLKVPNHWGVLHKVSVNGKEPIFENEAQGLKFKANIGLNFEADEKVTTIIQKPSAPFDFLGYQAAASRYLHISVINSTQIATALYNKGYITYPRTDSQRPSVHSINQVKKHIESANMTFVPRSVESLKKNSSKNIQEAHEALMPTFLGNAKLNSKEMACYELIKNRALASFLPEAKMQRTRIKISAALNDGGKLNIIVDQIKELEAGYKSVYNYGDIYGYMMKLKTKPHNEWKMSEIMVKEATTKPPSRFSEYSLINTLREHGIGRPSTVEQIFKILGIKRRYVQVNKRAIYMNPSGILLSFFAKLFFKAYFSPGFTSSMEKELDAIASGVKDKDELIKEFCIKIDEAIKSVQSIGRISVINQIADEIIGEQKCPSCKKGMFRIRYGPNGAFVFCNMYPDCEMRFSLNKYIAESVKMSELEV